MTLAKASVIVHRSDAVATADRLGRFRGFEVSESREDVDPHWQELTDAYADRREKLGELAAALEIEPGEESPGGIPSPDEEGKAIDREIAEMKRVIDEWQNRSRETSQRLTRLELLLQGMRRLEPVNVPVGEILRVRHLHLEIGLIPREHWERLEILLFRTPAVFIPLYESENDLVTVAATDRNHAVVLDRVLRSVFFRPFEWPEDLAGTPAELVEQLDRQQAETREELEELGRRRRQLSVEWRERISELRRRVEACLQVARLLSRCAVDGDYYFINGTIPRKRSRQLTEAVEEAAHQPHAVFTTSPVGENG